MITLTCGHTIEDLDDANDIALASYNREGNRCVDYVSYCDECYDAALGRGEVLLTVDDEDVWLQSRSAKDESADDTPVSDLMSLPPEQGITPDAWVILEINHAGKQFQKILAGWGGSYLYGDSWRMSSPIKNIHIDIDKDYITVETDSGSVYNLPKVYQGLRMSIAGTYNQLKERFGDTVEIVEI